MKKKYKTKKKSKFNKTLNYSINNFSIIFFLYFLFLLLSFFCNSATLFPAKVAKLWPVHHRISSVSHNWAVSPPLCPITGLCLPKEACPTQCCSRSCWVSVFVRVGSGEARLLSHIGASQVVIDDWSGNASLKLMKKRLYPWNIRSSHSHFL